jgi:hypothetical protein
MDMARLVAEEQPRRVANVKLQFASLHALRKTLDRPERVQAGSRLRLKLSQLAMCPAKIKQAGETRLIIQPSA